MKKTILVSSLVVFALASFSSCNKEQDATLEPKTYTLNVSVAKDPVTKQLILDESGSKPVLNAIWATGETVDVWAKGGKIGELTPQNVGGANAILSGSVTIPGSFNKDEDFIDLVFGGEPSTVQNGSLESLSSSLDWAKAWFQVTEAGDGVVVPKANSGTADKDGNVSMNNWTAIVRFLVKNGDSDLDVSKMTINGPSGYSATITPSTATNDLFVSLYNYSGDTANSGTYEIIVADTDGKMYSCKATDKSFTRGSFYSITLKVTADTYTAAGPSAVFNGKYWAQDASENDLVFNSTTGKYEKTFTVPSGTTSVDYRVYRNHSYLNGVWPADYNATVSSDNGYTATLTIKFDPATSVVSRSIENTSAYHLYIYPEALASSTSGSWGSDSRTVNSSSYNFLPLTDAEFGSYTYKHFLIPDALVDETAHDIYFKAGNGEIVLNTTLTSSTKSYYFRTNGILYTAVTEANKATPEAISGASTPRIYVYCGEQPYCHMWGDSGDLTSFPGTQGSSTSAKAYNKPWYYFDIKTGTKNIILSRGYSGNYNQSTDVTGLDSSKSYYYSWDPSYNDSYKSTPSLVNW